MDFDINKVIEGLEHCLEDKCENCPYNIPYEIDTCDYCGVNVMCINNLMKDSLYQLSGRIK